MSRELHTYDVRLVYERGHEPQLIVGDGIVNHTRVDLTSATNSVMLHALFLEHRAPIAVARLPPSVCLYMHEHRNGCLTMKHTMLTHCNVQCDRLEL